MWDQGYRCSQTGGESQQEGRRRAGMRRAAVQIIPCTVSQLLSAAEVDDAFVVGDRALKQVSVVGIVRRFLSSGANIQYSVDDMTGPPIDVMQWMTIEDPGVLCLSASLGKYVKVSGSLRNAEGRRSLLALNVYRVGDLNEITSHMLEVVQAHMQLPRSDLLREGEISSAGYSEERAACGFSIIQRQVWNTVKRCSLEVGISFQDLRRRLQFLTDDSVRRALRFLLGEGHIFSTIDDHHFKATNQDH